MMDLRILVVIAGALLASPAAAANAGNEPVAMVTDIKGTTTVTETGKPKPLTLLYYLTPGAELHLATGGTVVITYFTKPMEFTLAGPAEVTISADGPRVTKGNKAGVRTLDNRRADAVKKIEAVQRERMTFATVQMRSVKPRLEAAVPANTNVLSTTPEFSWTELPGITQYRFVLMDSSGTALYERSLDGTMLRLPKANALKYGSAYGWRVEAEIPPGPTVSATAIFNVIDAARAKSIAAARPKPGAPFSERLIFAARLESEGLGGEARQAWAELARERPDNETLRDRAGR